MKYLKILFLLIFFCFFVKSFAFDIASLWPINSSVIDKTNTLSNQEINEIEVKINELRNKYTTEILTVLIPTTGGEEVASVWTEIGQKIWVGKADKDNWVVILIAIEDRAWNISTWYGVEWVLPDLLTKQIGEKNFTLFREWRFKDGILWALSDFDKAFSWDSSIISDSKKNNWYWAFFFFILCFIEFPILIIVSEKFFKPMIKRGEKKKFFLNYFLPIIWIPLIMWLFNDIFYVLAMWSALLILMGTFWKSWKWWGNSRYSWWWGRWGGGFGWGSFGWGGSSWKW